MAYRKKTLRTMSPTARKVARLIGELESVSRRLKNLIPDLQRLDLDARALQTAKSGLTLSDNDAWGLTSALIHGQQTGYFDDNKEWAEAMLERIRIFRDQFVDPSIYKDFPDEGSSIRWEKDNEVHAVHNTVTGTTKIE